MMATVFASIGSNVDREVHIRNAIRSLAASFGALTISPIYENAAFGFDGDPFFNLVVSFKTDKPVTEVQSTFNRIENENGRDRSLPRFAPRTLDIDLLLYDDLIVDQEKLKLPRPEIYKQAFVLKPLSDIAGDKIDPLLNVTYAALWSKFTGESKSLTKVELHPID